MSFYNGPDIKDIIKMALREDIGHRDITTKSIIPKDRCVKAVFLAKEPCVVCGLAIAAEVFKAQDKNIKFKPLASDGQRVKKGRIIARICGKAQGILTAERVALNFISLLSGIATKTREYADKVRPYKVRILDTRKSIPGLRVLEKYAVRIGGGYNHRMRLDEMVMIKDNHLEVLGGVRRLPPLPKSYLKEIEVKDLKEFREALRLKPDIIMLDNMSITDMKKAVRLRNLLSAKASRLSPRLEASGGVAVKDIKRIASCGVDMISVGELTHSVKSADISLEIL